MLDDSDHSDPLPDAVMSALRDEIVLTPALEARTVRALRTVGVLGPHTHRKAERRRIIGTQAVAATVLFTAGVLLGQRLPARNRATSTSLDVQEAGTAYVAALVRLSQVANGEKPHNLVAGLEAGTATLRAAAVSLARLDPSDPVVRRIRTTLDAAAIAGNEARQAPGDSSIIRY